MCRFVLPSCCNYVENLAVPRDTSRRAAAVSLIPSHTYLQPWHGTGRGLGSLFFCFEKLSTDSTVLSVSHRSTVPIVGVGKEGHVSIFLNRKHTVLELATLRTTNIVRADSRRKRHRHANARPDKLGDGPEGG